MTNKEFDDIVKKKLTDFDNKSKPDWNSFSKKLETKNLQDQEFDSLFADKLGKISKPVKSSHWELLRKRLIKEEFLRRKVYTLKSIESFSLLLLLVVCVNSNIINFDFSRYADPELYAELFNRNEVLPKRINNQLVYNESRTIKGKEIEEELINNEEEQEIVNFIIEEVPLIKEPITKFLNIALVNQLENRIQNLNSTLSDEILLHTEGERKEIQNLNFIKTKDESSNLTSIYKPYLDTRMVYNPHFYHKGKTYYDLSFYGNSGMIKVNSPYDPYYNVEANTRYGSLAKIGVLVGAGTEKFKVKTGLEYQSISYKPQQVEEVFGSLANGVKKFSLDGIRYDIISLPLRVSYNLLSSEKASLNVLAGVNTNAIAKSKYKINEGELTREESLIYSSNIRTGQRSVNEEPILFQKEFNDGIFQKGGLDNIYFDANVELEYDRKISENKSFQIALGTNRFLGAKGIGPNNDALHSAYARLGISYKLN
jgi:hypothetical protein